MIVNNCLVEIIKTILLIVFNYHLLFFYEKKPIFDGDIFIDYNIEYNGKIMNDKNIHKKRFYINNND